MEKNPENKEINWYDIPDGTPFSALIESDGTRYVLSGRIKKEYCIGTLNKYLIYLCQDKFSSTHDVSSKFGYKHSYCIGFGSLADIAGHGLSDFQVFPEKVVKSSELQNLQIGDTIDLVDFGISYSVLVDELLYIIGYFSDQNAEMRSGFEKKYGKGAPTYIMGHNLAFFYKAFKKAPSISEASKFCKDLVGYYCVLPPNAAIKYKLHDMEAITKIVRAVSETTKIKICRNGIEITNLVIDSKSNSCQDKKQITNDKEANDQNGKETKLLHPRKGKITVSETRRGTAIRGKRGKTSTCFGHLSYREISGYS